MGTQLIMILMPTMALGISVDLRKKILCLDICGSSLIILL